MDSGLSIVVVIPVDVGLVVSVTHWPINRRAGRVSGGRRGSASGTASLG